jgi:hypothetical protein
MLDPCSLLSAQSHKLEIKRIPGPISGSLFEIDGEILQCVPRNGVKSPQYDAVARFGRMAAQEGVGKS